MNKLDFDNIPFYGRSKEYEALQLAYKRVKRQDDYIDSTSSIRRSTTEIIFVTGSSGTGKSTLVRKLRQEEGARFISGKFDQQLSYEPYYVLNAAFSELCDIILNCRDQEERDRMVTAIKNVLDRNDSGACQILLSVVSNLYKVVNGNDDGSDTEFDDDSEDNYDRRRISRTSTNSSSGEFLESVSRSKEAMNQLKFIFREFVRCVCTPSHPIILFIDDCQWADNPSLDIIKSIATDTKCKHLLIIGSYRDNEVDESHPLISCLKDIEIDTRREIERIHLSNLTEQAVCQIISDMIRVDPDTSEARQLAKTIHHKTLGNIFFVIQFVRNLAEENLLFFSLKTYKWEFDLKQVQSQTDLTDNVVDLVASKIKRQPVKVQSILKLAAAISFYFNIDFLEKIIKQRQQLCGEYEQDLTAACGGTKMSCKCEQIMNFEVLEQKEKMKEFLDVAVNENLVENLGGSEYKFSHDRIQQAAYSLIPEGKDRDLLHLSIGGLIWKMQYFKRKSMMFIAADQLNQGSAYIVESRKREELAKLNLQVGKAAMKLSAFGPASSYLEKGIALLNYENNWENQYDLSLKMYTYLADAEFCIGNFDSSRLMVEEVLQNAKSLDDKLRVYFTLLESLLAQSKLQECSELCLDVLLQLGEPITTTANARNDVVPNRSKLGRLFDRSKVGPCSNHTILGEVNKQDDSLLVLPLLGESKDNLCKLSSWVHLKSRYVNTNYKKIHQLLQRWSDEDLLELPNMTDRRKISIMKLYYLISTCYWTRDQVDSASLVAFRMVEITLQSGLCKASIDAFVAYATHIISRGKIQEASQYGKLITKMIDKLGMRGQAGRTVHSMVNHWHDPLHGGLDLLLESHRVSMKTGDIDGAFMVINFYIGTYFFCGLPLKPLLYDIESFVHQMVEYKQQYVLLNTIPLWQCVLNLMGKSDSPLQMDSGSAVEQRNVLQNTDTNKKEYQVGDTAAQSLEMQLCYYFGEYERANQLALKLRCVTEIGVSNYVSCVRVWFFGLISLALARTYPKEKKFKREGIRIIKKMTNWVEQGAINCAHKLLLLKAEHASIQYNQNINSKYTTDKLKDTYDNAILTASRAGFLQDAALANERAGIFFLDSQTDHYLASHYLCEAYDLYSEWGAKAKTDQLENDYPEFITFPEKQRHSSNFRGKSRFDPKLTTYHKKISLNMSS